MGSVRLLSSAQLVKGLEDVCEEWLRSLGWFSVPSCKKAMQLKWQNKAERWYCQAELLFQLSLRLCPVGGLPFLTNYLMLFKKKNKTTTTGMEGSKKSDVFSAWAILVSSSRLILELLKWLDLHHQRAPLRFL